MVPQFTFLSGAFKNKVEEERLGWYISQIAHTEQGEFWRTGSSPGTGPSRGLWKWLRNWSICLRMLRMRELGLYSLDSWEGTSSISVSIWREEAKMMEQGSSQWCWAVGQDTTGRNRCTEVAAEHERELCCAGGCALEQTALDGDIQELCGGSLVQCALLEQGGWIRWHTVVPSSLTQTVKSVIAQILRLS